MITLFLGLMLFVLALVVYAAVGIVIIFAITAAFFFSSLLRYSRVKNITASQMLCPNCGSTDIKIHSVKTGKSTNSVGTIQGGAGLWGLGSSSTSYIFQREGICQSCGFNYNYYTPEEVEGAIQSAVRRLIISGLLFFLAGITMIVIFNPIPT